MRYIIRYSHLLRTELVGRIHTGFLVSLSTLGLLAGVFIAAEMLLRWFVPPNPGLDPQYLKMMLWATGPCYRVETSHGRRTLVEISPPGYVNPDVPEPERFPLAKRPGITRVVITGESSAQMMENALSQIVRRRDCGDRYEILHCSVPGGDLQQVERRFKDALDYDPDAIIVIFGHNVYFSNPSNPATLRVQLLRSHSRLLSYLVGYIHSAPPAPDPVEPMDALEHALRGFADEAAAHHTILLLNTMASNLRLQPVVAVGENDNHPEWFEALLENDLGRRDDAIGGLRKLNDQHPSALVEFQLAEWLYERGDYQEARGHFEHARDTDEVRSRASSAVNDRIRAAAQPPVMLRDTERVIADSAPHNIPGWESFIDNCHLSTDNLYNEAVALLSMLGSGCGDAAATVEAIRIPWLGRNASSDYKSPLDVKLASIFGQASALKGARATAWWGDLPNIIADAMVHDEPSTLQSLNRTLGSDHFTRVDGEGRAAALVAIAEGFWRAGQRDRAMEFNERARVEGTGAAAWVQRGHWSVRIGQTSEALADFESALKADPSRADAAYFAQRLKSLAAEPE